ncbi:hypothetical protein B9Z55_016689 [Caenorhabditis nigoni]|nr:hypothetical protein B9Z55_016689 [Caenorhabditis nigoni]
MVNYLPGAAHLPICRSRSEKKKQVNYNNNDITSLFENKLASQDKSVLNQTFTLDTNKEERCREFCIEDAINGFLPRARSSGPRTSSMKNKHDENVRR